MSGKQAKEQRKREEAEFKAQVDQEVIRQRRIAKWFAIGMAVILSLVILVTLAIGNREEPSRPTAKTDYAERLPQAYNRLGSPQAPVEVIEFVDMQCPFCAGFSQEAMPQLAGKALRSGKAQWRLYPIAFIGPDSRKAALAAYAASLQNKMYQFTEAFFRGQGAENSGYADALILAAAREAQLNLPRFRKDLNGAAPQALLSKAEQLANRYGVQGTPTILVGMTKDGKDSARRLPSEQNTADGVLRAIEDASK